MKYLLKLLKVLIWPILFMIGQFFIRYLFVIYYNTKYYSGTDLYKVINTIKYQNNLNKFINNNTLLIIFIVAVIFIPFMFIKFKRYRKDNSFDIFKIIELIIISVLVALFYNLIIIIISKNRYKVSTLPIMVQIISSGIIGPIIEELLFRGIVYNKLKEFNSVKISIVISTIIFSLFHFSIIDCIYTIFMGLLFTYIYEKYNTLKYSILMHVFANTIVILLSPIIINQSYYINFSFLMFLLIVLCYLFLINSKHIKNML